MKRIIERSKPKQAIIEGVVVSFFNKYPDCERAIIEIKKDKAGRSKKQNDLYWMWLDAIEKETGQPAEDFFSNGRWCDGLHRQFRKTFLPKEFYEDGTQRVKSSTELNVGEFKDYLERIDMEMAEMGILLPRPEDLYWDAIGVKRAV